MHATYFSKRKVNDIRIRRAEHNEKKKIKTEDQWQESLEKILV